MFWDVKDIDQKRGGYPRRTGPMGGPFLEEDRRHVPADDRLEKCPKRVSRKSKVPFLVVGVRVMFERF